MITTKQRAYLRSLANNTEALYQIGKNAINDNLLKTLSDALEARELIKISVHETCSLSPREAAEVLCGALDCSPVQVIGRKIVLFRQNEKKPVIELKK